MSPISLTPHPLAPVCSRSALLRRESLTASLDAVALYPAWQGCGGVRGAVPGELGSVSQVDPTRALTRSPDA